MIETDVVPHGSTGSTSHVAKIPLDFVIDLTVVTQCPECGTKYEKGTDHECVPDKSE